MKFLVGAATVVSRIGGLRRVDDLEEDLSAGGD